MFFRKKASAAAAQYPQRRKHDRVAISIPVFLKINDREPIQCEAEDISLGGARIRCPVRLSPGDRISVEFRYAGTKTVVGTIVDVDEIDSSAPLRAREQAEIRWGQNDGVIGVQFVNPSSENQKFLKKLVRHLDSMKKG